MQRTQARLNAAADARNSLHIQGALAYVVPYNPSDTDLEALIGVPCDGVQVDTDDYSVIYASPAAEDTYPGARVVAASPDSVTAGWTDNGNGTFTHANGGGTNALSWSSVLTQGAIVLVKYTVTGMTLGTITASAGTTNGAATAADASVRELIAGAGNQTFAMTPTNDFDGTIGITGVLPRSALMKAGVMSSLRASRIEALLDAAGAEVTGDSAIVHLGWYRYSG